MPGSFAHAQAPPAATVRETVPVSAKLPVLQVRAEEVSLDLVVRDKKNRAVLDLKPGDLSITDDGVPVELSALRLINGKPASDHLVTLVFDQLDSSAAKNAHDTATRILKLIPQSGFTFAVTAVDSRLRLLQDYTTDRNALSHAIAVATGLKQSGPTDEAAQSEKRLISLIQTGTQSGSGSTGGTPAAEQRARARVLLMALEGSQRIMQDRRTQPSLAALEAIGRAQRNVPGRKVVIYFAHGLQQDPNTGDAVQSIVGMANKAGVSIYVIDSAALDPEASQQLTAAMAMGSQSTYYHMNSLAALAKSSGTSVSAADLVSRRQAGEQAQRYKDDELTAGKSPLPRLAAGTGGVYLNSGEGLRKPMRRLVEDMTTYYEASYVPLTEAYDGRFRAVAIKPLRAGLMIRSKAGYFSLPPTNNSGIQPFEAPMLKALTEPVLPAEVAFQSAILHMGNLQSANTNELVIEVPVANLEMRKDANTNLFSVHLSMMAQIRSKDGKLVEHFSEDIPRHGALDAMQAAKAEVITLQRHFTVPPGEYVLEAAVLDRNSGQTAARRNAFEVAGVGANPIDGPALSDMALVRRMDPVNRDVDPLEPLRYQNARIVPNLSGEVPAQSKAVSLFFIFHPGAPSSEPAKVELQVLKDGKSLARSPLQLGNSKGDVPYLSTIQVQSLSPGTYELVASVTQGAQSVTRTTSFILGGSDVVDTAATQPHSTEGDKDGGRPIADAEPGASALASGGLIITSSTNPVAAPRPKEIEAVLEGARQRALNYSSSLPNFTCVEITNRSIDHAGNGRWKHKDKIAEMLRYRDNQESHLMLEVNGRRSSAQRSDLKGPMSSGEFGGVLKSVFDPTSKASFQWKETVMLSGEPAQVFSYRVLQANSAFTLSGDYNYRMTVGFHGLVYIDNATRSARRITLEADVPSDSSIRSTSMEVEYQFVSINAHDYLMPVRAKVALGQGKHQSQLNEIEFRDYRRFGSQVRVLGFVPVSESK